MTLQKKLKRQSRQICRIEVPRLSIVQHLGSSSLPGCSRMLRKLPIRAERLFPLLDAFRSLVSNPEGLKLVEIALSSLCHPKSAHN